MRISERVITVAVIALAVILVATMCSYTLAHAKTRHGLSTPNGLTQADRKYGHLDVYRKYFGGLPRQLPNRAAVVSFKASPSAVLSGRHDAYLRSWFRNLPNNAPIWWAYWHEPIDNFRTSGQQRTYRRAWQHITHLERSTPTNGNLRATFIESMSAVWKGEWSRFYPGNRAIDVIGFDGKVKNWDGGYVPAKRHYDEGVATARRHNKPFALAEYGSTVFRRDYRGRAEWMRNTARWLENIRAPFGTWWDQRLASTRAGDFRLRDAPSISAMRGMLR